MVRATSYYTFYTLNSRLLQVHRYLACSRYGHLVVLFPYRQAYGLENRRISFLVCSASPLLRNPC